MLKPANAAHAALLILVALFTNAAAQKPKRPAKQPSKQQQQPSQAQPRAPKKKLQAVSNFADYAGRDASNRLIIAGATRKASGEAARQQQLGEEAYAAGRYEEAAAALRRLTQLTPRDPVAFYKLGQAHEAARQRKEAAAAYRKALELAGDDDTQKILRAGASYNLGNVLADDGQAEEAIDAFRRVTELLPTEEVAHYNLGWAYAAAGRTREAVASFREAVRLKPDFADARYNLGLALLAAGDKRAARAEALSLEPLSPQLAARLKGKVN